MRLRLYCVLAVGLILSGILTGCTGVRSPSAAPDPSLTFARFAAKLDHLNNIAFPMLVASAELCRSHVQDIYGFEVHDRSQYTLSTSDYADAAMRYYGLDSDKNVTVRYVHPDLPAGMAGLRTGTKILSIDGTSVENKTATEAREMIVGVAHRRVGPLHLVVQQHGSSRELNLNAVHACKYPVVLIHNSLVNAFADGKRIVVTTGMMDFIQSDTELALVIGHEIAHNTLDHSEKLRLEGLLDTVLSAHTGQTADVTDASHVSFSRELEAEADYVGLYLAARAGYDIERVKQFWIRIAQAQAARGTAAFGKSHPSTPERFEAFTVTLQEIGGKIQRHEPLIPQSTTEHAISSERARPEPISVGVGAVP